MDQVRAFAQRVARRVGTRAGLEAAAGWLAVGLGAAAALLLAERLLSLGANAGLLVAVPVVAAATAGVAAALARWPTLHQAAILADERFALHERLSTALAAGEGEMMALVRADAARSIAAIDLRAALPIAAPGHARSVAVLAAALVAIAFAPSLDLLGWGAARAARAADRAAIRQATEAARVGLARLAAAASDQKLDRSLKALRRMDDTLAELASSDAPSERAREAARKVANDLNAARDANEHALRAADPAERERAELERDLLLATARVIEAWQRELAAGGRLGSRPLAAAKAPEGKKDGRDAPAPAHDLTRGQELPPAPKETAAVETRLAEARPAAEGAVRRNDVPPQYRTVVRRYFSPDQPVAPQRE